MADVKRIAPTRIGGTDIQYAQGMRAGSWLFFTGHMASDFEYGLAAMVAGKPGLPLGSPPRYRREGDFIIDAFCQADCRRGRRPPPHRAGRSILPGRAGGERLSARPQGGAQGVRAAKHVRADGRAAGRRRQHGRLDDGGAAASGGDRTPKPAQPEGVPVPQHSGFIASLVSGDYVFVAGQMPNNEEMTGIAKPAYRPPNAVWNGTDIRLQAEFLITLAAQARARGRRQLARERDQGAGLSHQHQRPAGIPGRLERPFRATIPARSPWWRPRGSRLLESIIEINIFGVRDSVQDQEADHRSQGVAAHAAGPGGGARRRSLVLVGALCRRCRRRHRAGARAPRA